MIDILNRAGMVVAQFHAENPDIEQQLQQAHRQGWELAKAEARVLSFSCSCNKAIAAMEYKEPICGVNAAVE